MTPQEVIELSDAVRAVVMGSLAARSSPTGVNAEPLKPALLRSGISGARGSTDMYQHVLALCEGAKGNPRTIGVERALLACCGFLLFQGLLPKDCPFTTYLPNYFWGELGESAALVEAFIQQ